MKISNACICEHLCNTMLYGSWLYSQTTCIIKLLLLLILVVVLIIMTAIIILLKCTITEAIVLETLHLIAIVCILQIQN